MKCVSRVIVYSAIVLSLNAHANPYRLQYGGRLTATPTGAPLGGPLSLSVSFYHTETGGTVLATQTFPSVPVTEGVFNLTIDLSPANFHAAFSGSEVWLELFDQTNSKVYPRQRFLAVPYAFKIPVDGTNLDFTTNGQLTLKGINGSPLPTGVPGDGQILKWRSATGWEWGTDLAGSGGSVGSIDASLILDGSLANADFAAGAAISGTKIAPNFGSQNIVTTGTISGNGSLLTNLPPGPLGTSIDSTEITDGTLSDADFSPTAAIAQSKINGLSVTFATKEGLITAGTAAQYFRGDKSWSTLDTSAVPENVNLYYTDARARAAVSGTAPIAYNSGTGAFSMAAATSVANGYLSSSDWLAFSNKQASITTSSTIDAGSFSTVLQKGLEIKPFNTNPGQTGEIHFNELSGSNFIGFKAPDALAGDRIWTLPAADGTNGQVLSTDGSGNLYWNTSGGGGGGSGTVTSITAGTGLSGGAITTSGTINLANTTVTAGSYTRAAITVDAQGRLTAATNGSSVSLSTEVTGTLPLGNGGTGATSASDARTNLGLGSLATKSAVATGDITDGTIADGDISSSAAIAQSKISNLTTDLSTLTSGLSGKEATITAGTSSQFWRGDKTWQTLDTSAISGLSAALSDKANSSSLGTMSSQASGAVSITGGTISGVTFDSKGIDDNATTTAVTIDSSGRVGVGAAPTTGVKLDISGGQIRSNSYQAAANTVAIDFANGNNQYTTQTAAGSGAISVALSNMMDGGVYTIAMQDTQGGTYSFTATGVTFKFLPTNGATVSGKDAIYTIIRIGTTAYVTWMTGF